MSEWEYNGRNSITKYVIGIEFATKFTSDTMKLISNLHPQFRKLLPRKVEHPEITFSMGVGPAAPVVGPLGAIFFDKIKPDGTIEIQLAVATQAVVFTDSSEYTRWHDFWPQARMLMLPAITEAIKSSALSALSLEVVNRFTWDGSETHIESNRLICSETPYIAHNVVNHKGMGHSFHGFAFPSVDPVGRRVDNINFALLDRQEDVTPADLALSYRIQFQQPISSFDDPPGGTLATFLDKKFDDLHLANNDRFKETIVSDIWRKMEGLSA